MDEIQKKIWNTLCSMSGEEIARVFTDFYGNQLLDENFKKRWLMRVTWRMKNDY